MFFPVIASGLRVAKQSHPSSVIPVKTGIQFFDSKVPEFWGSEQGWSLINQTATFQNTNPALFL